jgi:hypothetical protein
VANCLGTKQNNNKMKGARKYAKLFKTGQYEQLYITSSSHARGMTFRIQVLPKDEKAEPNGSANQCLNSNAIEVYGVISGNPGWTEEYGWKHEGKWQEDFEKLVRSKEMELEAKEKMNQATTEEKAKEERERTKALLGAY